MVTKTITEDTTIIPIQASSLKGLINRPVSTSGGCGVKAKAKIKWYFKSGNGTNTLDYLENCW